MATPELERKARCSECGNFVDLVGYDRAFSQCRPCSNKRKAEIEQRKNEAAVEMVRGASKETSHG